MRLGFLLKSSQVDDRVEFTEFISLFLEVEVALNSCRFLTHTESREQILSSSQVLPTLGRAGLLPASHLGILTATFVLFLVNPMRIWF